MILTLLPIFLLTGALFAVGAYFCGAFLFEITARQARLLALLFGALLIVLPPGYFQVYMLAKPKDPADPPVTPDAAAIPAIWLAILLLAIALGLWRAGAKRSREERPQAAPGHPPA